MFFFEWTDARIEHLGRHGVSTDDFEYAVNRPDRVLQSKRSGRPIAAIWQGDRWLYCVYDQPSYQVIIPITAFYVEDR